MAKIAADVMRALARRAAEGSPGRATGRLLARGDGWTVSDVICTSGPSDRPFEERHSHYSIAVAVAGTFQYRCTCGGGLITPGSLMLGSAGQAYECAHEHASGDRCVAFWYEPRYFERIAADAGVRGRRIDFPDARVPPLRDTAPLVAEAAAGALGSDELSWEELGLKLAAGAVRLVSVSRVPAPPAPAGAEARVTRAARLIERRLDEPLSIAALAGESGLSPYHFLRTFERVSGVTPHQYLMRARLREAAVRLASGGDRVLDVALECGFGDVSNFNRAFRAEFGAAPRAYRAARHRRGRHDGHTGSCIFLTK